MAILVLPHTLNEIDMDDNMVDIQKDRPDLPKS